MDKVQIYTFSCRCSVFPEPFLGKTLLSQWRVSTLPSKINWPFFEDLFLGSLFCSLIFCVSVFMLIPHFLSYHSFLVSFEILKWVLQMSFFLKMVLFSQSPCDSVCTWGLAFPLFLQKNYIYIYIYIYTHTHTHIRILIMVVFNLYIALVINSSNPWTWCLSIC